MSEGKPLAGKTSPGYPRDPHDRPHERELGERLLNVKEAAEFMGVKPKTVYMWVSQGRLHALRAGNRLRFRRDDLMTWLGGTGTEGR